MMRGILAAPMFAIGLASVGHAATYDIEYSFLAEITEVHDEHDDGPHEGLPPFNGVQIGAVARGTLTAQLDDTTWTASNITCSFESVYSTFGFEHCLGSDDEGGWIIDRFGRGRFQGSGIEQYEVWEIEFSEGGTGTASMEREYHNSVDDRILEMMILEYSVNGLPAVPLPASAPFLMLATGALGYLGVRRRRR